MMMSALQYSLYTTAVVVAGGEEDVVDMLEGIASTPATQIESTASGTLIAWTDPAFPAFVEVNEKKKWAVELNCLLVNLIWGYKKNPHGVAFLTCC